MHLLNLANEPHEYKHPKSQYMLLPFLFVLFLCHEPDLFRDELFFAAWDM